MSLTRVITVTLTGAVWQCKLECGCIVERPAKGKGVQRLCTQGLECAPHCKSPHAVRNHHCKLTV